jgi:beta-galactosidase
MKKLFNANWHFAKSDISADFNDIETLNFKPVEIPHDWLIYDVNNLYETSYGWYKKNLVINNLNKSHRLYFEGVYMDCTIYINKEAVFDWKYGYTSFEADISDFIQLGDNEIIVLVRHLSPNSRWYSGAGIYRNVWLLETEKTYIKTDSLYFSAKKHNHVWRVNVSAEVTGNDSLIFNIADITTEENEFDVTIPDEKIWSLDNPYLFKLSARLKHGTDEVTCRVGFREMQFTPDKGFFLNGKNIKINGVCLHHDLGCLGAAFNKEAQRRQLLTMKEMGANAVRTAHNPPAKEFMELCDELGILVNNEFIDMWEMPINEYDYARFFPDWYEKDVKSWVRRDRNHACLMMWSIGNEILDTHVSERGLEVTKMLHKAVRKHDPLMNALTTIGSNYMQWENAQACAEAVDLVGYNYGEHLYEEHHKNNPSWLIYGSETTSGTKSRGIYHFPLKSEFLSHENLQCSSLGNCKSGFQKLNAEEVIIANRDIDYCAGMFIWTGSDYLGEPSPYSTKSAYFGAIDTAGIKKDIFWLYKAAWTSEPVLHILPYWDFNIGQEIDVVVYTNLKEAELFINERSCGKKTAENYTLTWKVNYEEGKIIVVAGEYKAERRSFKDSAEIILKPDKTLIKADGLDLLTVEISTVDIDNNPVENACDRINITVNGAKLAGFDNGDSTDYNQYKSTSRKLFSGKAVAYIIAPETPGIVTVTAQSPGLKPAEIKITAGENISEIPVRKIELIKKSEFIIKAKIFPENATYTDLNWSAVTNSGVKTNIAAVEADNNTAAVKIIGDGEFRVRCTCNNGKSQAEIVSEYEFYADGYGMAVVNPYEFTPACLGNAELQEVSDGGLFISGDNRTVRFKNVNFGEGADTFELFAIYWHTNEPFMFKLNSQEFSHQADFFWQTYQSNTFKLEKPLCGVQDLTFEFGETTHDLHFWGFMFL